MKTTSLIIMFVVLALFGFGSGVYTGYKFRYLDPKLTCGGPKDEIPPVGSVMRVEFVADDGNFIAQYAGARLYYKPVLTSNKTKIILEAGKAYEVVDQKGLIAGGHQKMLVPIISK